MEVWDEGGGGKRDHRNWDADLIDVLKKGQVECTCHWLAMIRYLDVKPLALDIKEMSQMRSYFMEGLIEVVCVYVC